MNVSGKRSRQIRDTRELCDSTFFMLCWLLTSWPNKLNLECPSNQLDFNSISSPTFSQFASSFKFSRLESSNSSPCSIVCLHKSQTQLSIFSSFLCTTIYSHANNAKRWKIDSKFRLFSFPSFVRSKIERLENKLNNYQCEIEEWSFFIYNNENFSMRFQLIHCEIEQVNKAGRCLHRS